MFFFLIVLTMFMWNILQFLNFKLDINLHNLSSESLKGVLFYDNASGVIFCYLDKILSEGLYFSLNLILINYVNKFVLIFDIV